MSLKYGGYNMGDSKRKINNEFIKKREKYEWIRIWWESANDDSKPRVLLIGDSITAGYRPIVNEIMHETAMIDQLATSRAINDPALVKELNYMLSEYDYEVIQFNNGLHGWHIDDKEYKETLGKIIKLIMTFQSNCKIILVTTTPSTKKGYTTELNLEKNKIIVSRNKIVSLVAEKHGLTVNDLYSDIFGNSQIRAEDGSHYTAEGYKLLAEKVAMSIKSVI